MVSDSAGDRKSSSTQPLVKSGQPTPKTSSAAAKPSPLDNQLKDGKLTEAERKRRLDSGACLYCGETGHVVRDCPKRAAARARATNPQAATTDSADAVPAKQTTRATLTVNTEDSDASGKD